jgi:type IV pilus assembly protein PilE
MHINKNGFTLIELLVVVLIVGILAAIALPQYQKTVKRAKVVEAIQIAKSMKDIQEAYFLATGNYATKLTQLDISYQGVLSNDDGILTNEKFKIVINHSGTHVDVYVPSLKNLNILAYFDNATGNHRGVLCYGSAEETKQLCKDAGFKDAGSTMLELH